MVLLLFDGVIESLLVALMTIIKFSLRVFVSWFSLGCLRLLSVSCSLCLSSDSISLSVSLDLIRSDQIYFAGWARRCFYNSTPNANHDDHDDRDDWLQTNHARRHSTLFSSLLSFMYLYAFDPLILDADSLTNNNYYNNYLDIDDYHKWWSTSSPNALWIATNL